MEPHDPILAPWTAFYTITGSSAAALIGLMFVVITLISARNEGRDTVRDGVSLFSTPTVIHFGSALVISAVLCAPWHTYFGPALVLAIVGVFGGAYIARAMTHVTRNIQAYTADREDWLFYGFAPLTTYLFLIASGFLVTSHAALSSFLAAGCVLALILTGIRNSWDVVTYIAISQGQTDPNVPKE